MAKSERALDAKITMLDLVNASNKRRNCSPIVQSRIRRFETDQTAPSAQNDLPLPQ
jgi:hypothetical protein